MFSTAVSKHQIEKFLRELRDLKHWSCHINKQPYDPRTGLHARVDDRSTWCSYDVAVAAVGRGLYPGLGFIFSEHDPYAVIDLDEENELTKRIYDKFDSYSEISPGGKGCHIIVRGSVPRGRNRKPVEIYSSLRFMTVTGNVCNPKPIAERQSLLSILWTELGGGKSQSARSYDELFATNKAHHSNVPDAVVIVRLFNSPTVGVAFARLYNRTPNETDESENDQSLCNYLVNVTSDPFQVERIWKNSPLGQRRKTQRREDYRIRTVCKAFDRRGSYVKINGVFYRTPDNMER